MKGRPPKPLELLKLNGATRKNPKRYAERMKRASDSRDDREIGPPPEEFLNEHSAMAAAHLTIWNRLIAEAPGGCITRRHRTVLANACRLQAQIDRGGKVTPAMHATMYRYLTSFGMTGESRFDGEGAKGAVPPGESEESGWEAFAREDKTSRAG